jgi:hypothetical protein
MALIDQPLPNLFGGVSQQPALSRYLNQLEAQVNCTSDPVEGLKKRPPTEHVKKIVSGSLTGRPSFFKIDRDPDNRYLGMIHSGQVRVFDMLTGVEKTVTGGTNAYLATSTPHRSIRQLTVADYTFLANREITTARTTAASPSRGFEGLISVRGANYGKEYSVVTRHKVGSSFGAASYTTPRGDVASHIDTTNTEYIALQLATQLAADPNGPEVVEQIGSVIYVSDPSTDFTIEVEDQQGNEAMKALKDNVQRFSDLPEKAKEGLVLRIAGDQTSAFDDYWVRFTGSVWEETLQPESFTSLDPATLPHALIRNPDGTFKLEALPWVDRAVGDDDSCPFPSFLGQKISSMFYFRNRLGFLADENVILSQAGDYFNFFRTTVTQLLPGDPIDTPASDASGESSPVSILEHAVAFDKKLVIFARNAQFIMGSSGTLTPAEAEIDPVTSFACSAICRPVALGRYIYFPFDRDGATGLREFYVDGASQTEDAEEVTAHCPTYLPANILSMSGSTLENVLVALPENDTNKVFVYEYFWGNNEKLQSSWGMWEFSPNDEVLFFDFIENVGYMVIKRTDGYHLEKVRFRPGLTDTGLSYFSCLDHRVDSTQYTAVYAPVAQTTTITLPYAVPADAVVATGYSAGGLHAPGILVPILSRTGDTLTVAGNVTTWNLVIGVPYAQSFTLSRPYAMQSSGNGGRVANTAAVLKVKDYSLDYAGVGYFKAIFTPAYRAEVVKEFSGRILGATAVTVPPLEEGTFRMKTPTANIHWSLTVENASVFPSAFLSASWRGIVESKSTRV